MDIPFNPNWEHVQIRTVEPKTTYKGIHSGFDKYGYIDTSFNLIIPCNYTIKDNDAGKVINNKLA